MSKLQFSIGVLSWKGYDSLKNSLISYEQNGLSRLTNNKFICLPEYNEEGIEIAKKFNYESILIKKNIGILGGFKELAKQMPRGPILLLENDLELIENKQTTYEQIKNSIDFLSKHNAIQVRLRSRSDPGEPFVGITKYKQYWSNDFTCSIKRFFRPAKAKRLIGTSIYSIQNPERRHPKYIKKLSNEFYLVSSSNLNWANLAILVDRDSYLKIIIKRAEQTKSKNYINGYLYLILSLLQLKLLIKTFRRNLLKVVERLQQEVVRRPYLYLNLNKDKLNNLYQIQLL